MKNDKFDKAMVKFSHAESVHYRKMAGTLLRAESITKSRRYGIEGYKKLFIQHPDKAFSSYMNTFLYLRQMEESYATTRDLYNNKLK